jgi:hypothetical protein
MNDNPWEKALRGDATRLKNEAPDGLDQRIIRAVAGSPRPKTTTLLFRPAMTVLAAAAVLVAVFYSYRRPAMPTMAVPPKIAMTTTPQAQGGEEPLLTAADLLQRDPLQDEANSVYSDAHAAVNFLAINFLPSTPKKSG